MDTNAILQIAGILSTSKVRDAGLDHQTLVLVIGMAITAIFPTLAALVVYLNIKDLGRSFIEVLASTRTTATTVEQIHLAVNSERTAMMDKVKRLRDEIVRITQEKGTLEDQQREQFVKDSVAAAVVAVVAAAGLSEAQVAKLVARDKFLADAKSVAPTLVKER